MSLGGDEGSRAKLRLLLTPSELEKLDAAVLDTRTTRSLIVLEALQAGLADPDLKIEQEKRDRRVDAWATILLKEKLRFVASRLNVTQQHLTRTLLLTYLASAPWNHQPNQCAKQSTEGGATIAA